MFISFVIPCYRESREQLYQALDSLLFLNALCDWEAWIVDDGSPKGKVCKWVEARQDSHLHAIRQANQGQSVARNTALDRAEGEYLAFLDADDRLIPESYATLIDLLLKERPDALGLRYKATSTPYYDGDALTFMSRYDVVPSVCAYIVRREVLGDLRFTPGIYHEDEEFVTLLHLRIRRLLMTPVVAYQYNVTQGSTITSSDEVHLSKRFDDMLGVISRLQCRLGSRQDSVSVPHSSSLYEKALTRRLHVLAMCVVVGLIRDAGNSMFVLDKLRKLKALGLYPLPRYSGIRRYAWIRMLTFRPWMLNLWRFFLQKG